MVVNERTLAERMWFAENRGETAGFSPLNVRLCRWHSAGGRALFLNQFDPPVGLVFCFGIVCVTVGEG